MTHQASDTRPVKRCPRTLLGIKINKLLDTAPHLGDAEIAALCDTSDMGYVARSRYFHDAAVGALRARRQSNGRVAP